MGRTGEEYVQLATRVPKRLHRRVRMRCLDREESVMEFVIRALERALADDAKRPKSQAATG